MSTTTTTTTTTDAAAEIEVIEVAMPTDAEVIEVIEAADSMESLLESAADAAETLTDSKSMATAAVSGYEAAFPMLLDSILAARSVGATHSQIAAAIAARRPEGAKKSRYEAAGSISNLEVVAAVRDLDGDLAEGFVWRVGKDDAIALGEGEKSLTDAVWSVIKPLDADVAAIKRQAAVDKAVDPKKTYGKKVAEAIIEASANKAEACRMFEATAAAIHAKADAIRKAEKASEKADPAVETYIKSAKTQIAKISEALDAGRIGDPVAAAQAIADLAATLKSLAGHANLSGTTAV